MDKAICSMKSGLGFTRGCHVQTVRWITMSGTRYVTEKVGNRNLCCWVRQGKGVDPFYRWFMPAINGFELWLDHWNYRFALKNGRNLSKVLNAENIIMRNLPSRTKRVWDKRESLQEHSSMNDHICWLFLDQSLDIKIPRRRIIVRSIFRKRGNVVVIKKKKREKKCASNRTKIVYSRKFSFIKYISTLLIEHDTSIYQYTSICQL